MSSAARPGKGEADVRSAAPATPQAATIAAVLDRGPTDPLLAAFVPRLLGRADADDLAHFSHRHLLAVAESFLAFLVEAGPRPGETRIRVRNPGAGEGVDAPCTIIEVNTRDKPFLVDSLLAEMTERDYSVRLLVHPILTARRDGSGRLLGFGADASREATGLQRESAIHLELDPIGGEETCAELAARLAEIFAHVERATSDWKSMVARLEDASAALAETSSLIEPDDLAEAEAFIDWLARDNFLFLGAREYAYRADGGEARLDPIDESGLGVLADPSVRILRTDGQGTRLAPDVSDFLRRANPVIITKSNTRSLVHRRVYMDYIGIKIFRSDGALLGEHRFVGLFTASAYHDSPEAIPILRQKVRFVLARSGVDRRGHDEHVLRNVLQTFPRDELFQADVNQLLPTVLGIVRLSERPRTRVFVRYDEWDRFASILVFIPRERFSTETRMKVAALLVEMLRGRVSAFYIDLGDRPLTRVHFIIGREPGQGERPTADAIEARVAEIVRSWTDGLKAALAEAMPRFAAADAAKGFAQAFTAGYRETNSPETAVKDIERIGALGPHPRVIVACDREPGDPDTTVRIRLYRRDVALPISDLVPVIEHMGLRAIAEAAHPVHPETAGPPETVWIHDLVTETRSGKGVEIDDVRKVFEEAFVAVWEGDAEADGFNALALLAGLSWRQVALLRALVKYRLQAGTAFSQAYMEATLTRYPLIARDLVAYFEARHALEEPVRADAGRHRDAVSAALETVERLDDDRIIRSLLNLVDASLRTNYFKDGSLKGALAIKLEPARVEELPAPRPYREIFVCSPEVEAVHLRFGPVARGGLRWSDRREDFRREILGLVKAQQVKNAVIVPVGAKGGFFPKRLPAGPREAVVAAAIAAYKTFIRGLLDLTDNLPPGAGLTDTLPPPGVATLDAPDPYLVVAADKGTATFSDIANGVAADYGFWLDDAFASGGSNGYDHKAMGITARGAWKAVERHFRELGRNINAEPFTVVGVGDMSGDVFGNGMLLARTIKLVAAFDHRDIFLDPDPDPEQSFAERKRLFDLPRSSWQDYDRRLISQGGGVFSRTQKSIALDERVRAMLGTEAHRLSPPEIIRLLLSLEADLLWFGGIGTYIRGPGETDYEVGDQANAPLRIPATEVRAKVIGEGANLAVTQRGRIAAARRGVRLNTDAIDNSAGVDCSDHEVNIKILLARVVAAGALDRESRNALLAAMTDDVARLVLEDNYEQTLALTLAEATATADLDAHQRLVRGFERAGRLDRAVETLPSDDAFAELKQAGLGLTRPELAVLLAYTKIDLFRVLCECDVPDLEVVKPRLRGYFPPVLAERYGEHVASHPLRSEIIATILANEVVNVAGITFVSRVRENTGADADAIVRAFLAAAEIFGIETLRSDINALDNKVPADVQTRLHLAVVTCLRRETLWLLRRYGDCRDVAGLIATYQPGVARLMELIHSIGGFDPSAVAAEVDALVAAGVPGEIACRVAALAPLTPALDVVDISEATGLPIEEAQRGYLAVGNALNLRTLIGAAEQLKSGEHWDRLAIRRITADLAGSQRTLAEAAMLASSHPTAEERVEAWLVSRADDIGRYRQVFDELELKGTLTIAKLTLAVSQMADLVARLGLMKR